MFKIIGADGKEYGPVSIDQLRNWLAQKRITAQTRILAPTSNEWRPAADIPELSSLFAPPSSNLLQKSTPPVLEAPESRRPKNGMAVLSFVLGLSSLVLCLSFITALPAIILGHISRKRVARDPERFGGSGFGTAGIVLGYASILVSLIAISMLMQVSSGPRRRSFNRPPPLSDCQNNLRQLGLAFKVWALEHNDRYPFNVSTNSGGSLELCARDAEGFEKDPAPHLVIIANDLSNPAFLVCPKDSKRPATDFSALQAANVSYRLRTGTNINEDNPQEILAVCPIHGNVLYCDGNVRKKSP